MSYDPVWPELSRTQPIVLMISDVACPTVYGPVVPAPVCIFRTTCLDQWLCVYSAAGCSDYPGSGTTMPMMSLFSEASDRTSGESVNISVIGTETGVLA